MTGEEKLQARACAVYNKWLEGETAIAKAMINMTPSRKVPYIIFVLTIVAVSEGRYDQVKNFMLEILE